MASPKLILGAVILHLVFLASVFDIYFVSPVLDVPLSHAPSAFDAPARRVVLFVADGLRADTFFRHDDLGRPLAPYLRDVMENHGTFGVSHTRVPTESRPGHVAMIAGMYEDPSAITRGWKENPVDFDTVFNQSRLTYSWGSPDIIHMFAKGVTEERMHASSYAPEEEDLFGRSDLVQLDTWVFGRVENFFNNARENTELQLALRQDKLVLFLHLLGCDSNGHAHRPHSKEYKNNVKAVDEGIRKVVEMVEEYWRHDDRTAFVFTADHGMADWGAHGTGMRHETEVPLVAWGAGVKHPEHLTGPDPRNEIAWRLGNLKRSDVNQADIAPLMSVLIGAAVPKNSVGKLPTDYLKFSPAHMVEASQTVTKQVYEMLRTAESEFDKYYYTAYPNLDEKRFQESSDKIQRLSRLGKEKEALELSSQLYEEALEGVEYYRKYYRFNLYLAVSASYIGFILWTALSVLQAHSPVFQNIADGNKNNLLDALTFLAATVAIAATLLQNVPLHYMVYYLTPVIVWRLLLGKIVTLKLVISLRVEDLAQGLIISLAVLAVIEFTVLAFFDRVKLSAGIAILTAWQLWTHRRGSLAKRIAFVALNTCLCLFTFLPSVSKERNAMLVLCASGLSGIGFLLVQHFLLDKKIMSGKVNSTLVSFLFTSGVCVWLSSLFNLSETVRVLVHTVSWVIFATGIPLSLTGEALGLQKLLQVCMALQASYNLLSLSYEGLFGLFLSASLLIWLLLEDEDSLQHQSLSKMNLSTPGRERNVVSWRDVLRSLQFVFYILLSFFGTGNIASLNSFDPRSIQCLVTVFNPFLMGGLLLVKVLIPFLLVSCFMYVIKHFTQMNSRALFFLIMLFSDVMSLHFFFLVTDEGSWLDIGTSLSHFVISEAVVIFLIVLLSLAGLLLRGRAKMLQGEHSRENAVLLP